MHGRCKVKPGDNVPAMRSCMCICVHVNGPCHKKRSQKAVKSSIWWHGNFRIIGGSRKNRRQCEKAVPYLFVFFCCLVSVACKWLSYYWSTCSLLTSIVIIPLFTDIMGVTQWHYLPLYWFSASSGGQSQNPSSYYSAPGDTKRHKGKNWNVEAEELWFW